MERLIYTSTTDYIVNGFDKARDFPLAITDMYVLPTDKTGKRMPWIFMSYVVATDKDGDGTVDNIPITETQRVDVCGILDIQLFISNLGDLDVPPYRCNLQGFFDFMRKSNIIPVAMPSPGLMEAELLLLPTTANIDACILQLRFSDLHRISDGQNRICFETPDSFVSGGNFPTRPGTIQTIACFCFLFAKFIDFLIFTQAGLIFSEPCSWAQKKLSGERILP